MAEVMSKIGDITHRRRGLPPFQALTRAIIHQQLSGQAAATIFNRFLRLFGNSSSFPSAGAILTMDINRLRSAGLSGAKAAYIQDVARKTIEGTVPTLGECHRLTDADLIERLTSIKGIGRWTVEMLLIFNLGRADVLPIDDLGVRRGYQIAYRKRELPAPEQLQKIGLRWAPFRTTAALYLWRITDFSKKR